MAATAEKKEYQHMGKTAGIADHDHDLIHELDKRLDALWHYDQYIANANGKPQLQELWRQFKNQCQSDIDLLKEWISQEVQDGCF